MDSIQYILHTQGNCIEFCIEKLTIDRYASKRQLCICIVNRKRKNRWRGQKF